MSQYLNDDFTIELKIYFLESLSARFRSLHQTFGSDKGFESAQILSEAVSWAGDAKTNEILFFSRWLDQLVTQSKILDSETVFKKFIETTLIYIERLLKNIDQDSEIFHELNGVFFESLEEQYLLFYLQKEQFALPLKFIREVTTLKTIDPLLQKHPLVYGYMAFRGQALPVIDLAVCGISEDLEKCKIGIICNWQGREFVICATETKELASVSEGNLKELTLFEAEKFGKYFSNVLTLDDKNTLVFDLETLVAA